MAVNAEPSAVASERQDTAAVPAGFKARALTPRRYSDVGSPGSARVLGPGSLTALGLGGLIGAGIFVTVGMAAHDMAGPAVILSLLVAAVACIAVALCYCECASAVPVAGSAYAYAYASVGELGAWLSGWNLATCYFLACAAVAQGWSGYFQSLLGGLGHSWPKSVGGAPFDTVFFAFGGFEMLSAYSHECRLPRRDVPLGVISTVSLLTLLYVAVAAAVVGMVSYDHISVRAPISDAFRSAGMPWAQLLVAIGAVAGMTSVLLVAVMSLPRVLMAIGQDGLLPARFFNAIHPVYRTPSRGVLLVGLVAMALSSLLPLRMVMSLVMMATLAGYVAVCAFVLVLRRRPWAHDPVFRAPFGPVFPIAGITICSVLIVSLPPVEWFRLACWWAVGLVAYAAAHRRKYGRRTADADLSKPTRENASD